MPWQLGFCLVAVVFFVVDVALSFRSSSNSFVPVSGSRLDCFHEEAGISMKSETCYRCKMVKLCAGFDLPAESCQRLHHINSSPFSQRGEEIFNQRIRTSRRYLGTATFRRSSTTRLHAGRSSRSERELVIEEAKVENTSSVVEESPEIFNEQDFGEAVEKWIQSMLQNLETWAVQQNNTWLSDMINLSKNDEAQLPFEKITSVDPQEMGKWAKNLVRKLAAWSLEDYKWRSDIFKKNQAERQMEESLARMRGDVASTSYVRPMDADESKIGPLGKAEKSAVEWLSKVIEEEAKRAQRIAEGDGGLVRPIDMESSAKANNTIESSFINGTTLDTVVFTTTDGGDSFSSTPSSVSSSTTGASSGSATAGPLAELERKAVDFLKVIADSETERASTGTLRPMQLEEAKQGPLGKAEARLVKALEDIKAAEVARVQLQNRRLGGKGEVVRPIDVPGPLGEIERAVLAIVTAERKRAAERQKSGGLVRPMEAELAGPLGDAERQVSDAVERVKEEERERLQGLKRWLEDSRPMERRRNSALGWTEAFAVGVLRAPRMVGSVVKRVMELMQSDTLTSADASRLQNPSSSLCSNTTQVETEDGEERP